MGIQEGCSVGSGTCASRKARTGSAGQDSANGSGLAGAAPGQSGIPQRPKTREAGAGSWCEPGALRRWQAGAWLEAGRACRPAA